jgi:hypothetical protein
VYSATQLSGGQWANDERAILDRKYKTWSLEAEITLLTFFVEEIMANERSDCSVLT